MKWYDFIKPRNWAIVKVYRDIENYRDWCHVIKKEQANPNSNFNKWKLAKTKLCDVYLTISLEDSDAVLPETIKRIKLMEILNPLHKYLDEDLGFAECINCEFNQFEDDQHNPTLSYLIVYSFRWNKFSLKWLLKFIIKLGISIFIIVKFIIPWLSNLI